MSRFAQRSAAKLGVRVQEQLQICLEGWSKTKTVTSLLNIPSVLGNVIY